MGKFGQTNYTERERKRERERCNWATDWIQTHGVGTYSLSRVSCITSTLKTSEGWTDRVSSVSRSRCIVSIYKSWIKRKIHGYSWYNVIKKKDYYLIY